MFKIKIKYYIYLVAALVFCTCGKKREIPDVSNIKAPIAIVRSELDFFHVDTTNVVGSLDKLQ